jgi:hypothetical protein
MTGLTPTHAEARLAELSYQPQATLVIRPWRFRIVTTSFFTVLAAAIIALIGLSMIAAGMDGRLGRMVMGGIFVVAGAVLALAGLVPLHLLFASLRVGSHRVTESRFGFRRELDLLDVADVVVDDPEHDLVLVMRNGHWATVGLLDHCHPDDRQRFLNHLASVIERRDDENKGR